MARKDSSVAMNRLPFCAATTAVVPEPQKKSATRSPEFDEARMMRFNNASGFWVGYPVRSLCRRATTGKYHQSSGTFPRCKFGTLPKPALGDEAKVLTVVSS